MLKEEFMKRTGLNLRAELYDLVEQEYYNSEKDKDSFCEDFVKNRIPWLFVKAEELILQYKLIAEEKERILKETLLLHQKEVEKLEKRYEILWGPWKVESSLKDENYKKLEESCRDISWDDGFFLDHIEDFGFDRNKIYLRKVSERSTCGNYIRRRECDKRRPLYYASDWNFIPFSCGGYDYEIIDGGLYMV